MPRLLIAAILALVALSLAVPQDTRLPLIIAPGASDTATSTATFTPTGTSTATSTSTSTATNTATATATATETKPAPGPCPCSGDTLNCSDFNTKPEAQACMDFCINQGQGDIHKLDQDNDGDACESLPGGFRAVR